MLLGDEIGDVCECGQAIGMVLMCCEWSWNEIASDLVHLFVLQSVLVLDCLTLEFS
jgi:hypothetical protein